MIFYTFHKETHDFFHNSCSNKGTVGQKSIFCPKTHVDKNSWICILFHTKEVSIAAFSSAALVPKRGSQLDETLQTTQKLKTFLKKYGKILLNGFKRKINFLPFFHFVKNSKKNLTLNFLSFSCRLFFSQLK